MFAQSFANNKSIQAGQQEVEEDQVGSERNSFLDGIDPIGGGSDRKTVALEIETQEAKKVFIVVNQQYFLSHRQAGQPQTSAKKQHK